MCKVTLIFVVLVHAVCGLPRSSQEAEADHSDDEGNFETHPRTSRDILLQKDVLKELSDFIVNDDLASEIIHYDSDANKRLERSNDGLERLKRSSESVLVQDEKPDSTEYLEYQRCLRRERVKRSTVHRQKRSACQWQDSQIRQLNGQVIWLKDVERNLTTTYREMKKLQNELWSVKNRTTAALDNMAKRLREERGATEREVLKGKNLQKENSNLWRELNELRKREQGVRKKEQDLKKCTEQRTKSAAEMRAKNTALERAQKLLKRALEDAKKQDQVERRAFEQLKMQHAKELDAKNTELRLTERSLMNAKRNLETCEAMRQSNRESANKFYTESKNCEKMQKQHIAAIDSKLVEFNNTQELLTQVQRNFLRQEKEVSVVKENFRKRNITWNDAKIREWNKRTQQNLARIQNKLSNLKKELQKKNVTAIILEITEFSDTREWLSQVRLNLSRQENEIFKLEEWIRTNVTGIDAKFMESDKTHEFLISQHQEDFENAAPQDEIFKYTEPHHQNENDNAIDGEFVELGSTQELLTQT